MPAAMSNPFLNKRKSKKTGANLRGELKRLFGGFRAPLTLLFVFVPAGLALAGGWDALQSWLYTLSQKVSQDKRPAVFFLNCVTHNPAYKQICNGSNSREWTATHKMQYWPFVAPTNPTDNSWFGLGRTLGHPQPLWLALLGGLALIAFVSIGNPNFSQVGTILAAALGIKTTKGKTTAGGNKAGTGAATTLLNKFSHPLLPAPKIELVEQPATLANNQGKGKPSKATPAAAAAAAATVDPARTLADNWIIGGTVLRSWEADPGYFETQELTPKDAKDMTKARPPYFITPEILRTNLLIVAPQGSGKTTSVFRPCIQFLKRLGGAGVVWDSKGDDFDYRDFDYNFDLEDPERSFKLVIFSGRTPEEAGERLAEALIPELDSDKKYFSDIAKDAMSALTAAHVAAHDGLYPEPAFLQTAINKESIEVTELIEQIPGKVRNQDEANRLISNLVAVANLADVKGDLLGNVRTALAPLTSPEISRFLVANKMPDDPNTFTIEELLQKPGLIRLGLPVSDRPRVAPIIGRLILAQFVFAVLSPKCNRNILKMALVDEARHFISLPICNGMAQARSNNAGFMLAMQTLSQITNDSMLETIFSLAGTKLAMGGLGDKDAERFSRTFGKVWLEFVGRNENLSKSSSSNTGGSRTSGSFMEFGTSSEYGSKSNATTNYGRSTSKNTGSGTNTSQHERSLFSSYEIRSLPTHHAIIETSNTYGQRWQAQIIDMGQGTVQALDTAFNFEIRRLLGKKSPKALTDYSISNPARRERESQKLPAGPQTALLTEPAPGDESQAQEAAYVELATNEVSPDSSNMVGATVADTGSNTTRRPRSRRVEQPRERVKISFSPVNSVTTSAADSGSNPSSTPAKPGFAPIPLPAPAAQQTTPTAAVAAPATGKAEREQKQVEQPQTDFLDAKLAPATNENGKATGDHPGQIRGENVGGAHIAITTTNTPTLPTNASLPLPGVVVSGGDVCAPNPTPSEQPTQTESHSTPAIPTSAQVAAPDPAPIPANPTPVVSNNELGNEHGSKPSPTNQADQPQSAGNDNSSNEDEPTRSPASTLPLAVEIETEVEDESQQAIRQALIEYGVDAASSEWLARQTLANGRDLAYIHQLAAKPNVENVAAYLNWAIANNANPPSTSLLETHRREAGNTQQAANNDPMLERMKQALMECKVAPKEAEKLARQARSNGRDYDYIKAHANKKGVNDLGAWLNFAISRNLPPPPDGGLTTRK